MMNIKQALPNYSKFIQEGEVLLLDDPQQVWLIQSGSVALFVSSIEDANLQGVRRYLFTVEMGESIFGFAIPSTGSQCILAVPNTDTKLQGYDRTGLGNEAGHVSLITWLQQLGSVFDLTGIPLPLPEISQIPWQAQLETLDNFQH
jgi:hypothetical protein